MHRIAEKRTKLFDRHLLRLPPDFIDNLQHRRHRIAIEPHPVQIIKPEIAIAQPNIKILRRKPESSQRLNQKRNQLDFRFGARLPKDIRIKLIKRPQPPPLLPLISILLADRKPFDRTFQTVRPRPDHPRKTRRHLRTKRHFAPAPILKRKKLADDLISRFLPIKIERLQNRRIIFRKSESICSQSPRAEKMISNRALFRIKIPKTR